jgi:zinc/manganese transport system substrate-binding protein
VKAVSQYLFALTALGVLAGCGSSQHYRFVFPTPGICADGPPVCRVVAIEGVYGDLARQIGGSSIAVTTILSNPSADPHEYEPTARDADAIASADLVIENGLGYDAFADKLIAASPRPQRSVITVGELRHRLGDNPHVWYDPATLIALSTRLRAAFGTIRPSPGRALNRRSVMVKLWALRLQARLQSLGERDRGARVAITEPVFDYVLHAANVTIATPASFSHAIEEGNDPAPQDVDAMQTLLSQRRVSAFVYNEQTIEPATTRLLAIAKASNVTVVPVTESLPANQTTQGWIDGEVTALEHAL